MADENTQGLAPLSELDGFKVAEGDPDIRGWDVLASDGSKVGEVEDLVVDTAAMKVRYLDVELDDDRFENAEDRHVLVPIGQARLDDDNDNVLVSIDANAFPNLPPYTQGGFSRDYETSLRQGFTGTAAGTTAGTTTSTTEGGADFYDHADFDESRFLGTRRRGTADREGALRLTRSEEELAIGKRAVQAGEVEVSKRIETERVRESVPVTREEVTIERHPVEAAGTTGQVELTEDEIRVPIMEEEVIVEKRVVPKEEVVIRKEAVQEQRVVEDTIRRERIEVDREGDIDRREEDLRDRI